MGGNESKSEPQLDSSGSQSSRSRQTRTKPPTQERVPAWPKNSARWQKLYDVYICSSDEDICYAKDLLAYLQEQPEGLRCFLPMRDMNPGGAIPTEMTESAENSHCWVMLLTFNFLSDQWCQFQMQQFLTMAPQGDGRMIPILVKLPFQFYPKELRYVFCIKDPLGDQKVFGQLRKALIHYLTKLPIVSADQDPREESSSSTTESRTASSLPGTNSQITSSQKPKCTSDTAKGGSVTQGSTDDTSLGTSKTQECTNTSSVRRKTNQEEATSLQTSITQEITSNPSTQMPTSSTSEISSESQETIKEVSIKNSYIQSCTQSISGRHSPNQQFPNSILAGTSITQGFTANVLLKSNVSQESPNETCSSSWSPNPNMEQSERNYETLVSNYNTLPEKCKTMDSSTLTMVSTKQEQAVTRKVDGGPFTMEGTIEMTYKSIKRDFHTSPIGPLLKNNDLAIIQNTSRGGDQMNKDFPQVDIYSSCSGTYATMNPLDLQREEYTSCPKKADNKQLQSLQSNIYTCCGETSKTIKDEPNCRPQEGKNYSLNLLGNIYTSSGRSIDVQLLQKYEYTNCERTETKNEDSARFWDNLYESCSGTENTDSPSYVNTSCEGRQAQMQCQGLQTDIYTSCKGNQREIKSPSFQNDEYTCCNTQEELDTNFLGDTNKGFGELQAPNRFSKTIGNSINTCSKETQTAKNLSDSIAQTKDQESGLSRISCTGCSDTQAEEGLDLCVFHGNVYFNCGSTQVARSTIHTLRGNSSIPASEAADKT